MKIEFIPDYGGDPALVVAGSRDELKKAAELMADLASGGRDEAALDGSEKIALRVQSSGEVAGLRRDASHDGRRWAWIADKELWAVFAEKVLAVVRHPGPSHNYLETDRDEATLVVSCEEFPPNPAL